LLRLAILARRGAVDYGLYIDITIIFRARDYVVERMMLMMMSHEEMIA